MYHGSNPTALQSQKMIVEALLELMKEKEFAKINIKELCEKAMISRQTFYTLFDGKEEVIELHLDTLFHTYVERYLQDENSRMLKELCDNTIAYMIQNKELICLMVRSNLDHLVKNKIEYYLSDLDSLLRSSQTADRDYAISFLAGGLMSVISRAVKNNDFEDGAMISQLMESIFTGSCFCI
ncbi:MAG: TetR/AcrR family transcriptional regulator [Lachnospiraceae bacterium]|nr:TetR/AcrR family transcriptional regulator [Lachnospiraceae bacterium]